MKMIQLYCGHEDVAAPIGSAVDLPTGWRMCVACAAYRSTAGMLATGTACLYLTNDNAHTVMRGNGFRRVSDWLGGLSFNVFNYRHSKRGGGFGSQREDFDFVGPDGWIWHGIVRGDMQLARCKRTKQRPSHGMRNR